jgi:hypothetical protein
VSKENPSENPSWHCYYVAIVPKKRIKEGDRINGELPPLDAIKDAHPEKVERFQKFLQAKGSNPTSRHVLRKLSEQLWKKGLAIAVSFKMLLYVLIKMNGR